MAYTINKYSGATLVVVQDGTLTLQQILRLLERTMLDMAKYKMKLCFY